MKYLREGLTTRAWKIVSNLIQSLPINLHMEMYKNELCIFVIGSKNMRMNA